VQYLAEESAIFILNPPYHRKDEIKERLNGEWSDTVKRGKGWKFPRNLFVYRELYKFFSGLKNNQQFMKDYEVAAKETESWLNRKDATVTPQYDDKLRGYQMQDAWYLECRGSCLVLNEPRTGKTPTMITVMRSLNKKKNLVVCPSSLVLNWAKEFSIWNPQIKVHIVNGRLRERLAIYEKYRLQTKSGTPSVLIISKDTWKQDKELHEWQYDVTIVDEAHFLRNTKSAQSQAIFKVKSHIKYALTGTPAVKHGSDIYGLLHFIKPEEYSSYWAFAARYWDIERDGWGADIAEEKPERRKELMTIMSLNSVQRKRKDIMKWLPAQTRQILPVQMTKKQLKYYEQMLDSFEVVDEELEHGVDTLNILSQLTRLRQICLDPRLIGFSEVGGKTKALLEFAEDNEEPFIVFSMFSSYFKLVKSDLEKLGKKVYVIDGSTSKQRRQDIITSFQAGHIDILLANIIAAGTGLTLDRSDTVVFLDKSYVPADNEQAEDRIVPTTEERYHPINIISFVAQGTVDERINEILERKEDLTKIINKPEVLEGVLR
jgi:SNF2 family DNA or RNA helicase